MNEDKKTRKAPAFQFYADDFLAGTITMTNEERGAYIALLCIQWSKEALTENDFQRVCAGMPPHSQRICQSKFQIDADGNYRNQRLETEREKQIQYRKKQTDNANKRWLGNATAYATALPADMPNACSPSPSPTPNNKEESIAPKSQRSTFVVPSVEEIESECARIGLAVSEASKFANYYESKGWIVGKTKMKSWKSALIGWKNRQIEFQQQRDRQQALSIAAHSKTVLSTNIADYQ
jgi:uncharacterized protein YdaU (DUF1376 family)